jgi:hypothetical protein
MTNEILAALVAVYIVDVSGFTESWRNGLARLLRINRLRPLPPFDCGTCMAFWAAIGCSIVQGDFSLEAVAVAAVCSLLALPAGQFMQLIKEWACSLIGKAFPKQ